MLDLENLLSLKKDDSYHFDIPFSFILKNLGNGFYKDGEATMNVDVKWNNEGLGYTITHNIENVDQIRVSEGNGTEDDFYHASVEPIVMNLLAKLGIGPEALIGGNGDENW